MSAEKKMLSCYNRGCGADFDPLENKDGMHRWPGHIHELAAKYSKCRHNGLGYVRVLPELFRHVYISHCAYRTDSCHHHPGVPFFHDAYKGWSCCNKKSVDFTEFLNIKGCQLTKHSNVKPVEPVKPMPSAAELAGAEAAAAAPPARIVEPIKPSMLQRPDFNAPLMAIVPVVAPGLRQAIDSVVPIIVRGESSAQPIG